MDIRSNAGVNAIEEIEQESESKSSGKARKSVRSAVLQSGKANTAKFSPPENKFVIRLPAGLRKKILQISRRHSRSMNSEIVLLLGRYFEEQLGDSAGNDGQEALESRLLRKLEGLPAEKREALLALLE